MALIQVTPDLLTGKANELRGLKSEHDEAMKKMKTLITGLNEIWKGAKYESMQNTFTSFSEMLEDYAKLMGTAATKLQETDASLQATMNSFGA